MLERHSFERLSTPRKSEMRTAYAFIVLVVCASLVLYFNLSHSTSMTRVKKFRTEGMYIESNEDIESNKGDEEEDATTFTVPYGQTKCSPLDISSQTCKVRTFQACNLYIYIHTLSFI